MSVHRPTYLSIDLAPSLDSEIPFDTLPPLYYVRK